MGALGGPGTNMVVFVAVTFARRMRVRVGRPVRVSLPLLVRKPHVKLHAFDVRLLSTRGMDLPATELEFLKFALECPDIGAEINQRAQEHVAADPAEDVEIECVHAAK